jgi:DNA repair/transcription protein MET18/MMS19
LAASPLFANLATPLLLEKLSSSVGSAKKDALETLAACAPVYGATAIAAHFDNIWKLIKTEIFDSIDDVVAEAAVAALKDIAVVLVNTPGTWRQLANATLACCKNYMKESELKSLAPVGKTIRAVGSASGKYTLYHNQQMC